MGSPGPIPASGAWRPGDPTGARRFASVDGGRAFQLEAGGELALLPEPALAEAAEMARLAAKVDAESPASRTPSRTETLEVA